MLWSMQTLRGYSIRATDGRLGSVADFLFDDAHWTVRYLVVDTAWLFGRRVLIAAPALGHPDDGTREFPVDLSEDQVRSSPDVDAEKPVSRQAEADLHAHYGWIPYWGPGMEGLGVLPTGGVQPTGAPPAAAPRRVSGERRPGDPHLRSEREVRGYQVAATDGEIGEIDDFLVDDSGWIIRYVVVEIGGWFSGTKRVLLSPDWITNIEWAERRVMVNVTKSQVEAAPSYEPGSAVDRYAEQDLYSHYRHTIYWE